LALAGIAGSLTSRELRAAPSLGGVTLGAQTYSFRDIAKPGDPKAADIIVESMKACGLTECELWSPQIEPSLPFGRGASGTPEWQKAREALRQFRVEKPLAHFQGLRNQFAAAGIRIRAYNYSFNDGFSDDEISRGFDVAKALGASFITASTTVSVAKRVAPFAEKHKMVVAMHNHSRVDDPNEFATPESFAAAMKLSKLFKINLDIGHFTAANYDALAFLSTHAADITNLHIKDRKKAQGDNVPWGQGDTPIKQVLLWLKEHKSKIPAYIEYEYKGDGTVDEVKKCLAYAESALA
jgi:sugar phosphate isomerase/epimerase